MTSINERIIYSIDEQAISNLLQQRDKLRKQTSPDINELKNFLEKAHIIKHVYNPRALELKYQAMTTNPTTIEKTMSPYQLYKIDNPLWAIELSAYQIQEFLNQEDYNGKLSKLLFDDYYYCAKRGLYYSKIDIKSFYPHTLIKPRHRTP